MILPFHIHSLNSDSLKRYTSITFKVNESSSDRNNILHWKSTSGDLGKIPLDKRLAVVESKVDSTETRLGALENKLPDIFEKFGELI